MNAIIEFEDTNGNTLASIKIKFGKIVELKGCEFADCDEDYLHESDYELIRLQKIDAQFP